MAQIIFPQDFKEFLQLLNNKRIEYLLIGGYAVSFHGYPRATADMDIWVATNETNAKKLVDALKQFGFDTPQLSPQLFLQSKHIVRMGVPPLRIEIMNTISGVDFNKCFDERIVENIDDVAVNIISLKYLKMNKKASGRHKDLDDLENL